MLSQERKDELGRAAQRLFELKQAWEAKIKRVMETVRVRKMADLAEEWPGYSFRLAQYEVSVDGVVIGQVASYVDEPCYDGRQWKPTKFWRQQRAPWNDGYCTQSHRTRKSAVRGLVEAWVRHTDEEA